MSLVNALLTVGSAVPFVGELAESANQLFGSAREFGDKADDVAMAARRVNEVLGMVHLVAKNVENLEDGKDLVAAKMERLVSLLTQFNAAMRRFGEKGWLKRMWTVRTHVDSLGELDKEVMAALDAFRDVYRFATDAVIVQRTYRLEASISQLVAERVRATGESEEAARTALAEDPVVIQAVAIGAGVPPAELASELSEFRLEVRECFGRVEGSLDSMLARIRASAITRFSDKVVTRSFCGSSLAPGRTGRRTMISAWRSWKSPSTPVKRRRSPKVARAPCSWPRARGAGVPEEDPFGRSSRPSAREFWRRSSAR